MKFMKLAVAAAATLALSGYAYAQEKVTLQLKWVTQAQFAGYYVAKDKGFYKEAGLDVTIKPGGPDIAPPQIIAGGGADVIVEWMPAALAALRKGRSARQYRPALRPFGHDADLPQGHGHRDPRRFQGQDPRRVVLRQ